MPVSPVPIPSSRCRFGIARCKITPPVGMYHRMWGAALQDRSTGVHRQLMATAVVLADLNEEVNRAPIFLIAVDHCLLRPQDMHELLEQTSQLSGIPEENLIVTFSHTHAGGYLARDRAHLPGGDLVGPYLDELPAKLACISLQAWASMQPATLSYAKTQCGVGHHRDFYDEDSGLWVCGWNPQGQADQTLWAIRVTDDKQQTVATLVNYGCHPTTLAWQNTLISPDYIGMLRETVEQATSAPCAFLLSPCGDVGPVEGYSGDTALADRHGREAGYAALSALESLPLPQHDLHYTGPVISGATLGLWEAKNHDEARVSQTSHFRQLHFFVELPYRDDLLSLPEAEAEFARLQVEEEAALASGDELLARNTRAMCERKRRQIDRLAPLPPGGFYPYPVWLWQFGDAIWVVVEGEPYNYLQARLRGRFPNRPVIVTVLANGSRAWYLPVREAYDKTLYQVEVSLLAPGCLETVCDVIERRLADWLES